MLELNEEQEQTLEQEERTEDPIEPG